MMRRTGLMPYPGSWLWPRATAIAVTALLAQGVSAAALGEQGGTGAWPALAQARVELPEHTVYRPATLPGTPLPLFVWGNGGCSANGLAHAAYLREIASHGYVVVALGRPGAQARPPAATGPAPAPAPAPGSTPDATQPAQMLEAIEWATRENARQGSEFHGRIDLDRIAAGGHSCGGLQALSISHDPRIDTTLVLNSGIYIRPGGRSGVQIDKSQLERLHAPLLYMSGGPEDIAHENALDDVARIERVPVFFGALPVGHGGTFQAPDGGEWARVSLRWLDWQLKADADASWDFAGPACRLCTDARWSVQQKHLPAPAGPFRQSLYVPVRDGTRLAMNLYLPARDGVPQAGPLPVLFAFTPYRARYRDAQGRINDMAAFPRGSQQSLLDSGYALAVADIRGKGASYGARRGFQDRTEAQDGHDLVQWLAAQPWSSGRVGMYGCSYLGGTAIHVASAAPPALKAVFSGASDLDKFSFVRNGGITAQFNTRPDEPLSDDLMSVPLDADLDGSMLRAAVAEHADNTPMAPLWYGMPFRDSVSPLTGNRFWEEVGPYTYLDVIRRSGIATYFWSNWEDEPTAQVIQAAENLGGRLLLGPGTHCAPPPGMDFNAEVQSFFDEHLKDAPALAASRVTWWLDGVPAVDAWQRGESWPGVRAPSQGWYFGTAATLAPRAARRGQARFTVNYDVGPPDAFAFWVDSQHGRGSSFTSEPLAADHELVGYPVVHLRLRSDRPEPLLFAYLEQVDAGGATRVLAFGRLAAAYRKTGAAPYDSLALPWHTGRQADHAPLRPGREVEMAFALTPVSRVIPAGQQLRVVVTGADPRQRNLEAIRQDPPPDIELLLGGSSGSRIELPLRPRVGAAAE